MLNENGHHCQTTRATQAKNLNKKNTKATTPCLLTKSVYTPRTLLAAYRHVDQPTPALAADTVNPDATGMTAEQTRPDNVWPYGRKIA
jgi:hypothetical protein